MCVVGVVWCGVAVFRGPDSSLGSERDRGRGRERKGEGGGGEREREREERKGEREGENSLVSRTLTSVGHFCFSNRSLLLLH